MTEIKHILTEHEWEQYFDLRFRILRKPLDKEKGSEKDFGDEIEKHFALFENENLLAIGRLDFLKEDTMNYAQARFVCVEQHLQGRGLGKLIMKAMELEAIKVNKAYIILHARDYAIKFYESLGYSVIEQSHLLFGTLQHFKMKKKLM
jgi:predicted GNAT family N-acyltransferase